MNQALGFRPVSFFGASTSNIKPVKIEQKQTISPSIQTSQFSTK
jgi:hypothetical protein